MGITVASCPMATPRDFIKNGLPCAAEAGQITIQKIPSKAHRGTKAKRFRPCAKATVPAFNTRKAVWGRANRLTKLSRFGLSSQGEQPTANNQLGTEQTASKSSAGLVCPARFQKGIFGMPLRPPRRFIIFIMPPPFIFFIMSCICSNSLSMRLTS